MFDSVSVATTFKGKLGELGVIFCSSSEALRDHPELVRRYLGSVVPQNDNFFAALNSAVFTDGSFVYVPKGVQVEFHGRGKGLKRGEEGGVATKKRGATKSVPLEKFLPKSGPPNRALYRSLVDELLPQIAVRVEKKG